MQAAEPVPSPGPAVEGMAWDLLSAEERYNLLLSLVHRALREAGRDVDLLRGFVEAPPPGLASNSTSSLNSPIRGAGIGTSAMAHRGHVPPFDDRTSGCIGHHHVSGRSVSPTISMTPPLGAANCTRSGVEDVGFAVMKALTRVRSSVANAT